MTQFKPMLSGTLEKPEDLNWSKSWICSPKLDGIRCIILNGEVLSRKLKPIPNRHVRETLKAMLSGKLDGLDGELMLRTPSSFNDTSSAIMSEKGKPDFVYHVFDCVKDGYNYPYDFRWSWFSDYFYEPEYVGWTSDIIVPIEMQFIHSLKEFEDYEKQMLFEGYEGVMIRDPKGFYKLGRSTLKEAKLLKFKRFLDFEAEIVGFLEYMKNENPQETDELGHSKRSSKKENLIAANTLGALEVKDVNTGILFSIGSGFDSKTREYIWNNKEKLLGSFITYKCQEIVEKPRFPVFKGFRNSNDLSN